jgi:hypothetical protein
MWLVCRRFVVPSVVLPAECICIQNLQLYNHAVCVVKTIPRVAVWRNTFCSEVRTKHITTLCIQNAEFLNNIHEVIQRNDWNYRCQKLDNLPKYSVQMVTTGISLCFIKQSNVETYCGGEVYIHAFFTTASVGDVPLNSNPTLFPHINNRQYSLNVGHGLREQIYV